MLPVLELALYLADAGLPVLPLGTDKRPVGNCPACARTPTGTRCGGRPNMKTAGPCTCPRPCHGWAAATTNPAVFTSPAWARAWRQAATVAYHPGGAGLTVLDLDSPEAVTWARATLPATLAVPSTRGEHWIYCGVMRSHNHVRPSVDIKSVGGYARWLGEGTGAMTELPDAVRSLPVRQEATPAPRGGVVASSPLTASWRTAPASGCRHTDGYVNTGLARGLAKVRARTERGAGSQAFGVARFLAAQHARCPGPCGLEDIAARIIDAAVSVGVPREYAARAVANGMATAGVRAA